MKKQQEQEQEEDQEQEQEEDQERPYSFETLDSETIAWLAGILQAEAYFSSDNRVRAKSNNLDYTPPPPIPLIKLEMVEKDLMEYIAELVGQSLKEEKRETKAGNKVYRVTIQAREKTKIFLKCIQPYIKGQKNSSRIVELLKICDAYDQWVANGGKTKAAQLAAYTKAEKQKKKSSN